MDRNIGVGTTRDRRGVVALRKESVDRNGIRVLPRSVMWVALRKESVDRNILPTRSATTYGPSLSARRAWIEICARLCTYIQRYRRSPQGERG